MSQLRVTHSEVYGGDGWLMDTHLDSYATISHDAGLVTKVSIMNSKQFRNALKDLGLKQGEAAEFLDISIRAVNGYANGWDIPKQTAMLLRLMIKHGFKPEDVK